ncbi:MAG TPA: acylphosphatase [Candidatus Cloacimonetes bacterium]|nr:acylphosphatase [Candidatus Cloacimonadota bacterium]
MRSVEIYVSGRVQGVGYRYFVVSKANMYKIKGYTKNMYDGRVKIIACGDKLNLDLFIQELRKGPTFARVKNLEISDLTASTHYDNFRVEF